VARVLHARAGGTWQRGGTTTVQPTEPEIGETLEDLADYLSYWYNDGHPVHVIKRKQIEETP
jgi:hypothetical protein